VSPDGFPGLLAWFLQYLKYVSAGEGGRPSLSRAVAGRGGQGAPAIWTLGRRRSLEHPASDPPMHAMEKKARVATMFVAIRSESSGCVGVAHAALARVWERRATRGAGRTSASSRRWTATTDVATRSSMVYW
jgi:hypothetical protein